MPMVVVCTVTYNNSPSELARFAHAYVQARDQAALQNLPVRLLFRDNGAPSGLAQLVAQSTGVLDALDVAQPDAGTGNIGYGPAMHALWAHAFASGATAIVTANPDGAFHPQCIVRLHKAANRCPGHLHEARQFPSEHAKHYHPVDLTTDWASGCCVYVSRDLFLRVGNLDPDFWLYMEDVDFSWRVRAAGRKILVCPGALYGHETVQRELSARARRELWLAGRRLGWKWAGPAFQASCERSLQRMFPGIELPPLNTPQKPPPGHVGVTCFDKLFAFASTRWVL